MVLRRESGRKPHGGSRRRAAPRVLTPMQVDAAVAAMAAPSGTARFRAGKSLCATAELDAGRVYPHFDAIADLLGSASKVVCWNAMRLVALMAAADSKRRVDRILDDYLGLIRGDNLISAANAIRGAGLIGAVRPDLLDRIIPAVLEVEGANYATPECRNVAIGQALHVLQALGPSVCRRTDVARFIQRQTTNSRTAVARRAKDLMSEARSGRRDAAGRTARRVNRFPTR